MLSCGLVYRMFTRAVIRVAYPLLDPSDLAEERDTSDCLLASLHRSDLL